MCLTDQYHYSRRSYFGPFPDCVLKGLGVVEGGQTSSGSIVKWFKNNFCKDLESNGGNAYRTLNEEAAKIEPGADGLIVLDWWQGNRTPYTDSQIRGMRRSVELHQTTQVGKIGDRQRRHARELSECRYYSPV